MNKNEKNILNYLSNSTKYFTIKEISKKIGISETKTGSHCYNLCENKFLDRNKSHEDEKMTYRITTSGELQLVKENNSKKNLLLNGLTSYGTLALAVATIALALGTFGLAQNSQTQTELLFDQISILQDQTELFQKDFDYTNRPWLGIDKLDVLEDKIKMEFTNFGKIPNDSGMIYSKLTNYEFTQEEIRIKSHDGILHVTMPGDTLNIFALSEMYDEMMLKAHNGTWTLFLGAELEYPYGENKKGIYGFIGEYNPQTNKIDLLETWQS